MAHDEYASVDDGYAFLDPDQPKFIPYDELDPQWKVRYGPNLWKFNLAMMDRSTPDRPPRLGRESGFRPMRPQRRTVRFDLGDNSKLTAPSPAWPLRVATGYLLTVGIYRYGASDDFEWSGYPYGEGELWSVTADLSYWEYIDGEPFSCRRVHKGWYDTQRRNGYLPPFEPKEQ